MSEDKIDVVEALKWKYPEAICVISDGQIAEWKSQESEKPSKKDIKTAVAEYAKYLSDKKIIDEQVEQSTKTTKESVVKKLTDLGFTDEEIKLFRINRNAE